MDSLRITPKDLKKINTVSGSQHAGISGVLSFEARKQRDCWFVYVDWTTAAEPRPYYVGMGNAWRVCDLRRNAKHSAVARKHGQRREIVFMSSIREACLDCEIATIAELHTFVKDESYNGIGCNFTRGGDGIVGIPCSAEKKELLRARFKGIKLSDETRAKMSLAHKGQIPGHRGQKLDPETFKRFQEAGWLSNRGATRTQDARERMSQAMKLAWARKKARHGNS